MNLKYDIEGGDFSRAGFVSSEVKKLLKQLSLDAPTVKRIVIALYEAEVNVVAHAYRGKVSIDIEPDKIFIVIDDEGPGIPDIEMAMQTGFSTASREVREMGFGAGMGLPNIKKNVDSLDICSTVGVGTTVSMTTFFSGKGEAR